MVQLLYPKLCYNISRRQAGFTKIGYTIDECDNSTKQCYLDKKGFLPVLMTKKITYGLHVYGSEVFFSVKHHSEKS